MQPQTVLLAILGVSLQPRGPASLQPSTWLLATPEIPCNFGRRSLQPKSSPRNLVGNAPCNHSPGSLQLWGTLQPSDGAPFNPCNPGDLFATVDGAPCNPGALLANLDGAPCTIVDEALCNRLRGSLQRWGSLCNLGRCSLHPWWSPCNFVSRAFCNRLRGSLQPWGLPCDLGQCSL